MRGELNVVLREKKCGISRSMNIVKVSTALFQTKIRDKKYVIDRYTGSTSQ